VNSEAMQRLFVDLFIQANKTAPARLILDLDATDDPVHGHQEDRFFHGYYKCYCYLPLYVFCGRELLLAKLRPANIDAAAGAQEEMAWIVTQLRQKWPGVEIWLRADSGFCREELMAWCEANGVGYIFGLARNARLEAEIAPELAEAERQAKESGQSARIFKEFQYQTRKTWSRERRVVAKAEHLSKGANPRFIVTSLSSEQAKAQQLTNPSTALAARWRTASRSASSISTRIALRPQPCAPTSSDYGSLPRLCPGHGVASPRLAGNRASERHRRDYPAEAA
jgi:hypothetical protein